MYFSNYFNFLNDNFKHAAQRLRLLAVAEFRAITCLDTRAIMRSANNSTLEARHCLYAVLAGVFIFINLLSFNLIFYPLSDFL